MGNERIFEKGTIVKAKKLEVLTFSLGTVGTLKSLKGVIEHNLDESVRIYTKESPKLGTVYPNDYVAVVRVLGGEVLIDGKYDIYTLSPDKATIKLINPINPHDVLNLVQELELKPIFEAAGNNVCGYITPVEWRNVIVITPDMEIDTCYNEWDPDTPCDMCVGDVFVVTNEKTYTGYRIGEREFAETHILSI